MKNKYRQLIMERRSSKRYSVTEGVYAAFKSNRQLVGPVENICRDGLCFRYLADDDLVQGDRDGELILFSYNHGFYIDRIKCRIIRDVPDCNDPSFFDIDMKAMAVEFKGVDTETRNGISAFINRFGIDDAPPVMMPEMDGGMERENNFEYRQYMKVLNL